MTTPTTPTTPETRRERRQNSRQSARAASARVITPAVRRWAYGVAAAALTAALGLGWLPPGSAALLAPLLMAIFFVDETGEPRS